MDLTTKNGELSVGVRILDYDHREMTDVLHEIQAAATADADPRRTGTLLNKLAEFSVTHFALEEGMMAATKFPGIGRHRLNHKRIIEQMRVLASLYKRGSSLPNQNSLSFLSEMHAAHIEEDDLHYGLWLNRVGKR